MSALNTIAMGLGYTLMASTTIVVALAAWESFVARRDLPLACRLGVHTVTAAAFEAWDEVPDLVLCSGCGKALP